MLAAVEGEEKRRKSAEMARQKGKRGETSRKRQESFCSEEERRPWLAESWKKGNI